MTRPCMHRSACQAEMWPSRGVGRRSKSEGGEIVIINGACFPKGVRGHAPLENFYDFDLQRCNLSHSNFQVVFVAILRAT